MTTTIHTSDHLAVLLARRDEAEAAKERAWRNYQATPGLAEAQAAQQAAYFNGTTVPALPEIIEYREREYHDAATAYDRACAALAAAQS